MFRKKTQFVLSTFQDTALYLSVFTEGTKTGVMRFFNEAKRKAGWNREAEKMKCRGYSGMS